MNKYKKFVKELAENDPTLDIEEYNLCKFCQANWAESTYKEYLTNHLLNKQYSHHHAECAWVRANFLIRNKR